MNRKSRPHRPAKALGALLASLLVIFAVAATAAAATVVNGDFEAGNLSGWQQQEQNSHGRWFATAGTEAPLSRQTMELVAKGAGTRLTPAEEEEIEADKENVGTVLPPFQGNFDALADENRPNSMVLYQEVALDPLVPQQLSMYLNYHSFARIIVPQPNTLEVDEGLRVIPIGETEQEEKERIEREEAESNQQVRVDVLKGGSSPTSLDPADILTTLYATKEGDARQIPWTHLAADLTPFAGQKVILRVAAVAGWYYLNVGADAVSITSPVAPLAPPSNVFTFGKLKKNPKNGSATLTVNVPGPGTLSLAGVVSKGAKASASVAKAKKGKKKRRSPVKPASASATAAGAVTLAIKPTGGAKKVLRAKGALAAKVSVTYTPTGGSANTLEKAISLKLAKPKPKKKKKK